jgi:RHS repeat-associated protein
MREHALAANGNRLELATWGMTTTYDYDWSPAPASNRLREVVDNFWWTSPSGLYTYDAAGNPESIDDDAYDHGATGRLTWMCLENIHNAPACTTYTTLKHNAFGLLAMEDWDGPGTMGSPHMAWQFHYDEGGRLLTEHAAGWQKTADYIYLDDILVGYVGQGPYSTRPLWWVLTDHLGTPTTLIDSGGTVTYDVHYSAFGLMFPEVGGSPLPGFTSGAFVRQVRPGQLRSVWDVYYHNGYRTYDYVAGRYLQSDPIGLGGGLNTYAYALNNPLRFTDPLGLCPDIDDFQLCHFLRSEPLPQITGGGLVYLRVRCVWRCPVGGIVNAFPRFSPTHLPIFNPTPQDSMSLRLPGSKGERECLQPRNLVWENSTGDEIITGPLR